MRWKNQINAFLKKLRKMNYLLRNLNKILEKPKLRQVYLIFVESIFSYCIIDWGGAFNNAISQLEICQNQIIRIFLNKERMNSTKNVYRELNVLPLIINTYKYL